MDDPLKAHVDVEVRYFETDQMGVVHHVNYLVWFEVARTELCARSGHPYPEIELLGYRLMNTEHVWIETATNRPCRAPRELQGAFRKLAGLAD